MKIEDSGKSNPTEQEIFVENEKAGTRMRLGRFERQTDDVCGEMIWDGEPWGTTLATFYSGSGKEWGQGSQGRGYYSRAAYSQHFTGVHPNRAVDEKTSGIKLVNWLVIEPIVYI